MVIEELNHGKEDAYGSRQVGETASVAESGICGSKTRSVASGIFFLRQCKKAILTDGLWLKLTMPGHSLLSHGETRPYHRRYGVSLLVRIGSGGTTALRPPGKFCFIRPLLRSINLICIRLKIFSHPPKQLRRCKVKPSRFIRTG